MNLYLYLRLRLHLHLHHSMRLVNFLNETPATQLVDRKPPGKRKQTGPGPQTQRQTRSQVKRKQAKDTEMEATTGVTAVLETRPVQKTEPVSPPRKKLKAAPVGQRAGNKAKSSKTSQATSRSTRNTQDQFKVEEQSANEPLPAKSASTTTRSRKKATAPRKKKPTSVPRPAVNSAPRVQKRLIVKLRLRQRAQKDINALQEQMSVRYHCHDEL